MVCGVRGHFGWRVWLVSFFGAALLALAAAAGAAGGEDPRLNHARQLLRSAERKQGVKQTVNLRVDAGLGHPEAFAVDREGAGATIRGGGPAGVLYGVHEWLASPAKAAASPVQRPDFALRGTVLFLMKEANYDYQLTPEEFPWFYDRALLTRYFDYLLANRFNTIFLWSGHLFPSIVHLPEYPDATDLTREQLQRNQEQFRWFTAECARRNISVLVHFYQIHIPKPLARSRNIPVQYRRPNEFVTRFVRYSLGRFLAEFDSVGLYVCPGEALATAYQPEWIRDVIFAAARSSGRNPVIVVRDWTLDAERFKEVCVGQYENLYTELKHNVEMLVSPIPDERHARWKKVARKHIVNLHEVADVKPFRWGSPRFVREMAAEWKKIGLDGAEVYGMVSWRWPYALDKLDPQQKGFWPPGPKLLTFERDAIWLEAVGRYLWKVDRDPKEEEAYWTARLGEKFGNREAARLLLAWYDTTGPILPGLQNLTHVRNMNFFPTAIGREQNVDAILATAACDRDYPARPVDSWFFERYQARYAASGLRSRITLPVAEYAERSARGQRTSDAMTPDRVVELLAELAEEGLKIARDAERVATANRDEAARFVTDSQTLVSITRAWQHKVLAAIAKRVYQQTRDEKQKEALREHLRRSVAVYEELVALTDRTYLNATDMLLRLNWHEGLAQFKADAAAQQRFLALDKVPILYSTDLFHPHADPDDHYDLACLFAIPDFDVKGVILDLGGTQAKGSGRPAVEQLMHVTGRKVPAVIGLSRPLRSRQDKALDEPEEFQGAVRLILAVLRQSPQKVVLFTTGSCRDVAAAFNREPELLKEKVRAVYFNIGRGPNESQEECNVGYDPAAYLRLFESGLPLRWCPCFGRDGYETLYQLDQTAVVGACSRPVQNYFVYCLTKSTADPIAFLSGGPRPLPTGPRAMWCTAPMFDAAGRKVYQRGPDDFVALPPAEAEKQGLAGKAVAAFRFVPMRTTLGEPARAAVAGARLAEPPPGELAAAYAGRTEDRVGTGRPEPDGQPDCCVRVLGVDPQKGIKNLVLTGPNKGRWEYVATGRWWRLAYQRSGKQLDCYFQFYASGEHQLEIVFEDGSSRAVRFEVPGLDWPTFRVQLDPAEPNGLVFRATDPRYKQIMASALKNLLAGLGR